jgi:hypothetical protein
VMGDDKNGGNNSRQWTLAKPVRISQTSPCLSRLSQ